MGTYATTTSLQVIMQGTTFDTATTALASKCITWAENEVNKYLSKRYDIPSLQSAVPPLVTSLSEQMAEGYMYMRQSRGGKEALARGQAMIKEARSNLELIQAYKADLLNTAGSVIVDGSFTSYNIRSSTSDYISTFDEDTSTSWKVDQTKMDDIKNGRD